MDVARAYLSLILSLLPNLAAIIIAAVAAGHITQAVEIGIVIAILQPAIVAISPNLPDARYVKGALAVLLFCTQTLLQVLPVGGVGALSGAQWTMIVGAFLAAVLVNFFPNVPMPPKPVQQARSQIVGPS